MMTDQAALRQHIKELEEALTLPWWDVDDDTRAVLQAELDDCKEKLKGANTMIRKDVYRLAATLAADSGMDADTIYDFLMACGKALGRNPSKLPWVAGHGLIFLEGKRDDFYLEPFRPQDRRPTGDDDAARYWEDRILARQEAWMD